MTADQDVLTRALQKSPISPTELVPVGGLLDFCHGANNF
jgi:hypothetical protein